MHPLRPAAPLLIALAALLTLSALLAVVPAATPAAARRAPAQFPPARVLRADPAPALALAQADPPGWSRVDTGPFSVALPPGWRYEPRQGEDSFVGLLIGDGISLMFDLGMYWNSPPADGTRHDVTRERVDFRAADIYRPRDPADTIGLFIEHVDDFGSFGGPTHLSVVGDGVALGAQDQVVAIFRSVRFPRRLGDGRWVKVAPPEGHAVLMDVDARGGAPLAVGVRYIVTPGVPTVTLQATAFRQSAGDWVEYALPMGAGELAWAVAGDWIVTDQGLYHHDDARNRWQLERRPTGGNRRLDVAVDRHFEPSGWAIGTGGVIRLTGATSTETDGGWGTAKGISIDVLPRAPLARIARPRPADAMAVSGVTATLFDGAVWRPMPALPASFAALGVDLVADDEAWIVGGAPDGGAQGTFHRRLADKVTAAPVTATMPLWSVDLLSPAEGWAVGGSPNGNQPAELWRLRDGVWVRQPPPCTCHLHAVQALPSGEAWAVGFADEGPSAPRVAVVMRYVPGVATATATATPGASATASDPPGATTATASATATVSATRQSGDHRVWLPWAYRPFLAR